MTTPTQHGAEPAFRIGDLVQKIKGSKWRGRVIGAYSTALTPEGYAVESSTETGSVQIYPASALAAAPAEPAPREFIAARRWRTAEIVDDRNTLQWDADPATLVGPVMDRPVARDEAMERDAARYRRLRHGKARSTGSPKPGCIEVVQWADRSEGQVLKGEELDAAVDAAFAQAQPAAPPPATPGAQP